jgi:MFS transporter, DHA1 family, multidrug resistance protein
VREGLTRLTLVLGAVMAIGPLALDMYLPALPTLESEFAVPTARVQQTLSAYLFGMAIGQLVFGPLTDRFGRKTPLIGGLALFGVASAGCALATGMQSLILLRFAQALGGSSGMVVIRAVIRDRFDALQSAQVLSLMMLVMGVAPILAPLLGGWILVHGAWHWIFWLLTVYTVLCVAAVLRYLDESHPPHLRSVSIGRAIAGFLPVGRDARFVGPTLVFISSFGAFFAYLAGAPFVFIQYFGVPADHFGWYFGANALGFISVSQMNRRLVQRHGPRRVLGWGVGTLAAAGVLLFGSAFSGIAGFPGVLAMIFCVIASLGLIAPNAAAVAMEPFGATAGGASSLLGAGQSLAGVVASAAVGWVAAHGAVPMATVIAACGAIAFASYALLVSSPRTLS